MRRLTVILALLGLGLALRQFAARGTAEPGQVDSSVQVGPAYAIPIEGDRASIQLDFSPRSRYLLVLGSLGAASQAHTVTLAPAKESAAVAGWKRIEPLKWRAGKNEAPISASVSPRTASVGPRDAKSPQSPPAERQFSIHVTDGSLDDPAQYATVSAVEVARGRAVAVYLDKRQSPRELAPQFVSEIVRLLDEEVLPKFRASLGSHRDVDGDGCFTVLLTPWLGRLQGGRTSLGGFVRGDDFKRGRRPPFSNSADMLYLNPSLLPGPHLRTLLLHEYTHAVAFSRRTASQPAYRDEEDWLNEAIAHCCEEWLGGGFSNLDYRMAEFLNDPAAYPLVVPDYYRAGLWRCHGCRGATYLFLRYCLDHSEADVLQRMIDSPLTGRRNLEEAVGQSFADLFRGWTLLLAGHGVSPELSSVDLYGEVPGQGGDRWGLAGPRRMHCDVDGGSITITVRGTAATYVELAASGLPGIRSISIAGSPGSMLQASLIRIDPGSPTIETIAATRGTNGEISGSVEFAGDAIMTVEQISLEQSAGDRRASICLRGDEIISRPAGAAFSKACGPTQQFSAAAAQLGDPDSPIRLKVVARDARGRRAAAWTDIAPQSSASRPAQVAHRP